ncbi:MAG: NAD(P)/FAD-dependent oxidoreductase [Desulfobacteraceae bacterium]|nr:MAG: NAD(P)/FAD-dependent oxidoreductase [Desulfobacteraceae bacterium]
MKESVDVTIIGAGVVGLAIAEAVAAKNRQVVVLEKNDSFGRETSSRNSEVIHAGIYYPKEFLKSRLCLKGNRLVYAWCEKHRVPHRRIGKLIVATNKEECDDLERIKITAEDNGVERLEHLGQAQLKAKEPEVSALAALFSSSTGIIDTHRFMQTLLMSAEKKETIITYRSEVTAIHFDGSAWELDINEGAYCIRTKTLINSAGLHADRIAALAGLDIDAAGYRLKPCKGNYFTATPAPKIHHLIYPVPAKNNIGLGIHATLDLSGRVRFGPDSRYLPIDHLFNYAVDEALKPTFHKSIHKYLPGVSIDDLNPDMSGIRPKIQGPGDSAMDFIIREEGDRGFPGLINLIGIESPGLTACLAVGEYVRDKLMP